MRIILISWLLLLVFYPQKILANTETISLSIPPSRDIYKLNAFELRSNDVHISSSLISANKLPTLELPNSKFKNQRIILDLLSIHKEIIDELNNNDLEKNLNDSENLIIIELWLEVINQSSRWKNFNFKVCWNALNPIEIDLNHKVISLDSDSSDFFLEKKQNEKHIKRFINNNYTDYSSLILNDDRKDFLVIKITPNYYFSTKFNDYKVENLDQYLDGILLDIGEIDSTYLIWLIGSVFCYIFLGIGFSWIIYKFIFSKIDLEEQKDKLL
ncbi:hypothetical protein PACTADRAFT_1727 [Pachysolen tannophilus NRRL Y-2460]|uniref:Protein BIG1 n=1 Tax=Pachysolen tannophilus NRRL Y-2460 TaxID=669874 RepID=A0A1E4TZQ2_PACTA|nr:hypothetical protein PACTADRAFT_1727 [Pachysolen tannophilus NRRL Y-2460]